MKHLLFVTILYLYIPNIYAQQMGSFTDSRDGQTYKTVTFSEPFLEEGITVMAENLNYEIPGSFVFNDDGRYRNKFGLLYTWNAAIKACPSGWHLPSYDEWERIIPLIGTDNDAGEAMKSTTGWQNNGNGTNSSKLSMLPGGFGHGKDTFFGIGRYGRWWTSSTSLGGTAWYITLFAFNYDVGKFDYYQEEGHSCRCIKD